MTMLRLMLQMDEDKLPLAMLHSFCFSPLPATTSARATIARCNLTPAEPSDVA